MSTSAFADWFRHQLQRRGWNQSDFARAADIPKPTVSTWYQGTRNPDPASCDLIADVLNLDVDTVLTLAGHRPAVEPIDPDDPLNELFGMMKRVQWTEERIAGIRGALNIYLELDRKKRKG